MRLFIGIPLSRELKERFASEIKVLGNRFPNLNFIPKDNFHITILFIGEQNEPQKIKRIESQLKQIVEKESTFEISIKGASAFPNTANPRVLWVRVDSNKLIEIIKKIRKEFESLDIRDNHEEIIPHITIARTKYLANRERIINLISKFKKMDFGSMVVDRFVLFESITSSKGTVYKEIFEAKLK